MVLDTAEVAIIHCETSLRRRDFARASVAPLQSANTQKLAYPGSPHDDDGNAGQFSAGHSMHHLYCSGTADSPESQRTELQLLDGFDPFNGLPEVRYTCL